MASITIINNPKNLAFASRVANATGAMFREDGEWVVIESAPTLTLSREHFDAAINPDKRRRDYAQMDSAWRSLILNKQGYLQHIRDDEIVITDEAPTDKPRPAISLRFDSKEQKAEAEGWSDRAGYDSLNAYILAAVEAFNRSWAKKASGHEE